MLVRRSIPAFVRCMEVGPGNVEIMGLWVQLMHHLAENPLGGLEVVKAGATQVIMASLSEHSSNITFAVLAVKMLRQVASEPSHATIIAENGAPPMMLTLIKMHAMQPDLTIECVGVLASMAEVPSIHRLIVLCNAVPMVVEVLQNPRLRNHEAILTEGSRLLCYICRNENHRNVVTYSRGPETVVEVLQHCLEKDIPLPMEYCIEAIYHLAQLHTHRKAVVDSGGIEAIVAATSKYSENTVIQEWCLNAFGYAQLKMMSIASLPFFDKIRCSQNLDLRCVLLSIRPRHVPYHEPTPAIADVGS